MYLCKLNSKEGELRALKNLNKRMVNENNFIPLIVLNDASEDLLSKIKSNYDYKLYLSTENLSSEEISTLIELLTSVSFNNFELVVNFSDVLNNDIDFDFDTMLITDDYLNSLLMYWINSNNKIYPKNIILDFKDISYKNLNDKLTIAKNILNSFSVNNYDSRFFILSGSVPSSIPVTLNKDFFQPLYELEFYNELSNSFTTLELIYGDYSTITPIRINYENSKIIPNVQIKYTNLNKNEFTFFRNGQRRGNYDFVKPCKDLIDYFKNFDKDFCWANSYISDIVKNSNNKGNPSVWVSLGVNHHITQLSLHFNK